MNLTNEELKAISNVNDAAIHDSLAMLYEASAGYYDALLRGSDLDFQEQAEQLAVLSRVRTKFNREMRNRHIMTVEEESFTCHCSACDDESDYPAFENEDEAFINSDLVFDDDSGGVHLDDVTSEGDGLIHANETTVTVEQFVNDPSPVGDGQPTGTGWPVDMPAGR